MAGTKIPKVDNARFDKIKSIATSGAGTLNQGYNIEEQIRHGKGVSADDWISLGTSAATTTVHSVNTKKYWKAGVNPDGTTRKKGENPKYDWPKTKSTVTNGRAWRAGGTRVAGYALQYQLWRGPTSAPPPPTPTSVHGHA